MCCAFYTPVGVPTSCQLGCEMPAGTGGDQDLGPRSNEGVLKPLSNLQLIMHTP